MSPEAGDFIRSSVDYSGKKIHRRKHILVGKPRLHFPELGLSPLGLRHSGTLLHLWNLFPNL